MTDKAREIQLGVFKKELRYYVIKRKHIKNGLDAARVKNLLSSLDLPDIECVVVEHDWPMYHDVWDMIRSYVETGKYQSARIAELEHAELKALCMELVEAAESYLGAADPVSKELTHVLEGKLIDTLNKARGKL